MTIKTTIFNLFRKISQAPPLEKFFSFMIMNGLPGFKKLIAGHRMYSEGSMRTCTRDGVNYQLDISDYNEYALYFGIKDTADFDRRALYGLIKDGDICFDIGANIGETTLNFARLASKGKVYSFEPVPFLFERLKTNTQLNSFGNISLYNLAVSDKKEALYFEHRHNHNSSGISLNKKGSAASDVVHSTTVDDFVGENKIAKIDFMKIDVEGFENFVIEGAMNTLKTFKPRLFIEIDNKNLIKNNTSEKKLLSQIKVLGYFLYRIHGTQKIKLDVLKDTNEHYDVLCIAEDSV